VRLRSGIAELRDEGGGKLPLDVDVPLLDISDGVVEGET
jgi:hypothetical protein